MNTADAFAHPAGPATPVRRVSRRAWLALALAVVVAVASGAVLRFVFWPGPGPLTDPFNYSDGAHGTSGIDDCIEADTDFDWVEMTSLGNGGSAPLTIDRVDAGGVKDVHVVGTLVIPVEGITDGLPAWGSPPNRPADATDAELVRTGARVDLRKPAIGYRIAHSDRRAVLMVGLRPIGNKLGGIDSVTIHYHVGWRHFSKYAHLTVTVHRKNYCGS